MKLRSLWLGIATVPFLAAAPLPAHAVWDPPGSSGCPPHVICLGAPQKGLPCEVYDQMEEQSNDSLLHMLVWWMIENLPPPRPRLPEGFPPPTGGDPPPTDPPPTDPPPTDPPPSDPPPSGGDGGEASCSESRMTSTEGVYGIKVVDSEEFALNVRAIFDPVPEGGWVTFGPYAWSVVWKREMYPTQPEEYSLVLYSWELGGHVAIQAQDGYVTFWALLP